MFRWLAVSSFRLIGFGCTVAAEYQKCGLMEIMIILIDSRWMLMHKLTRSGGGKYYCYHL